MRGGRSNAIRVLAALIPVAIVLGCLLFCVAIPPGKGEKSAPLIAYFVAVFALYTMTLYIFNKVMERAPAGGVRTSAHVITNSLLVLAIAQLLFWIVAQDWLAKKPPAGRWLYDHLFAGTPFPTDGDFMYFSQH